MEANIAVPTMEIEFIPGAHLWFGTERIHWRVLEMDRERETALLIAEKPVCERAYHGGYTDVTWEECDLRAWLNGKYYENTFSDEEKAAILECELENKDNPKYGTTGGKNTKDRIFLLSIEEAEKFFKNSKDRATHSWWWLRSPGDGSIYAACVRGDGSILDDGGGVDRWAGVRPAFKINLESELFQSFISLKSQNSIILRIPTLNISGGKLYGSLPEIRDAKIPDGVTELAEKCFYRGKALESITLPTTLRKIGQNAFQDCESLAEVVIPESVTEIEESVLEGCNSLNRVSIPKNMTKIGIRAFKDCSSLTEIEIPESVTEIGEDAFSGCAALNRITVPEHLSAEMLYKAGLCRAISEAGMTELIGSVKKWAKRDKEKFFTEYLVSDTRAAMLLAEKRKELDKYAAMRGMSVDELRDQYLSDLGLDMKGCKSYDLGHMTVTVHMNRDFSFTVELPNGKTACSLPKKGADPEKFEAANKDFAQVKKDSRKIWKNRADLLLGDFITGKARTAQYWAKAYGSNPILHGVACLLVWQQGEKTFLRTDDGPITADGSAYVLSNEPIRIAHPIEMKKDELEAWQKYFISHELKQPFAQIWERAYTKEEIAEDRYAGCPILFFQLQGAEKHGFNQDLNIHGCRVEAKWTSEAAANGNKVSYCDIRSFKIETFSRAVNHALAYLDRVTIEGRIKKDDADVMRSVEGSNLAQVTDYIRLAQENSAINVLALLMEYKNNRFADFDPMDEFTLE